VEMVYVLQVSVRPFLIVCYSTCLLTCLLCYSAVAIVSSGRPRPAVLASHCDGRVARCVPWSREFFIPRGRNDTHRLCLCSPSSPSRCKSDGFPGLCGLAGFFTIRVSVLYYMLHKWTSNIDGASGRRNQLEPRALAGFSSH
jgi:hypothetical protein